MMASKAKEPATEEKKFPRKAVPLYVSTSDSEEAAARRFATLTVSPELAAYRAIGASETKTAIGVQLDVPTLLETLRDQAANVNRGDLSHVEAMLMNQATALQSIFARLAERGLTCNGLAQYEADMRIALRAQSQCRATLETLAAIKNPPVVYARQANVTTGPQQVNNGVPAPSHARENEIEPSKLSGDTFELRQDTGTPTLTVRDDPALATVGALDGTEIGSR